MIRFFTLICLTVSSFLHAAEQKENAELSPPIQYGVRGAILPTCENGKYGGYMTSSYIQCGHSEAITDALLGSMSQGGRGGRVLSIGGSYCPDVRTLCKLISPRDALAASFEFTVIDPDADALNNLTSSEIIKPFARNIKAVVGKAPSAIQSEIGAGKFGLNSFNFITAEYVFHFMREDDVRESLNLIHRLLKSGGKVDIIAAPDISETQTNGILRKKVDAGELEPFYNYEVSFYTDILKEFGFVQVEVSPVYLVVVSDDSDVSRRSYLRITSQKR